FVSLSHLKSLSVHSFPHPFLTYLLIVIIVRFRKIANYIFRKYYFFKALGQNIMLFLIKKSTCFKKQVLVQITFVVLGINRNIFLFPPLVVHAYLVLLFLLHRPQKLYQHV